jgi:hypothetical protein
LSFSLIEPLDSLAPLRDVSRVAQTTDIVLRFQHYVATLL